MPPPQLRGLRRGPLLRRRCQPGGAVGGQRSRGRGVGVRGHLAPRWTPVAAGRRRRRHPAQHQRIALSPRQGRRAPGHAFGPRRRRQGAAGVSQPGRWPGRVGVRRPEHGVRRHRRPDLSRPTVCRGPLLGGRATARVGARRCHRGKGGRRRSARGRSRTTTHPARAARRHRRGVFGPGRRPRRLRSQERLCWRGDRPLRRDRLRPHRHHRRRCPRPRGGVGGHHAVALLQRGLGRRFAEAGRQPRHSVRSHLHRTALYRFPRCAAARVRRSRTQRHRGESSGPDPRRDPHGALQQVWQHGGCHRKQVGDVGGLRHHLRRHGGRIRRAPGRVEDPRVRPGAVAQPRWRGDPAGHHRQAALSRVASRSGRYRLVAAL